MKIEDVFYKLRPVRGKQLDLLWQEYLVAANPNRCSSNLRRKN
jgi:hypothetical protein